MARNAKAKHVTLRTRLKPDERRRLIVEAAFTAVAQEGFEGLRTRDIAEKVGINSATLHHYFETKQDLVEAVAGQLERRLHTERSLGDAGDADPFGRQFEDLVFYQKEAPQLLGVYREFVARAPRDPVISKLVGRLHAGWRDSIMASLADSQRRGVIAKDIDIEAVAGIVASTAWGLVARIFVSATELRAAADQLEALLRPVKAKAR
jgi:AcrR family transcriptional regulator